MIFVPLTIFDIELNMFFFMPGYKHGAVDLKLIEISDILGEIEAIVFVFYFDFVFFHVAFNLIGYAYFLVFFFDLQFLWFMINTLLGRL